MSTSTSLLLQRGLLALSLAAAIVLLCLLARRRLGALEETARSRRNLLYEVLANVSEGLDRIEAGLDDIAARAAIAKTRLGQLTAVRRQNLLACAFFRERGTRRRKPARTPTRKAPEEKEGEARLT